MATTTIKAIELPNGDIANITDKTSGYVATDATTSAHGLMSASDKTKLNGIASGAEVNQNAFSNVAIGASTISADSKTDTLTLVGGANITLTPDATNDKITILLDDTVDTGEVIATDIQAGNLIVNGTSRFLNTINGTASNSEKLNGQSLTSTYSSTGTAPITGAAVASAIGTLDGTVSGSPSASKTLTAFSQTDGKVSATFGNISITKSQVSDFPTLGTAAAKNYTTSVSSGSADLVTSGAVWTAIDNLPEPMVFKGSLGTGGTITALPVDGTAKVGDTYKVITAGTYASKAAKVGDTFICLTKTSSANTWELIPSGDEPSGTVTSVGISNGGGLSVSGSPITSSGTITISHSDTSSQASVSNSGRTYIQSITLDTYGHVTKLTSATETVTNTDRYVNSAAFAHDSTNDNVKMTLTRAGSDTATVTANIPKVSSSSAGVAPKGATVSSQSQTTKFLREDGTWAAPSYTTNTNTTYTIGTSDNNVTLTPSSGSVQSITVPYATKATQDSDGNAINTTYLKLSGGTVTGQTTFNTSIHDGGGQTIFAGGATSSAWYKITLATNGVTPPSSQQWYMCSMTIHVGGSYGSAAKGIIEVSYYFYWTGTAFQATNVYATAIGNNMNNLHIYYKLTNPFVIYVNVASSYTSLWVDKVSYRDSSYAYRTKETKVEVSDAITTTDYSEIPIAKVYSTNGNNIFLNNSTFPSSNNSYNLGDPSYKWANVYATNFRGNNITLSTTSGISYEGTKNTYQMIRFIDNTNDTYGNGIAIGGGGQTIIGGGESAGVMVSNAGTSGEEIMYVGNDQNVVIFTGLQNGWDSKKTFTFDTAGALTATKFIGALQGNADTATSATTASKLGSSNVGSATNPIYLASGTATACTYSLNKTVPSDAVFTDQYVSQSATTTSDYRKIVLSYQNGAAGAAVVANTNVVYVTANAEVQPSTGNIRSGGTVSAANLSASGNVSGTTLGVISSSGTGGGISLYNGTGNVTTYGIAMRKTTDSGKHGYVQGDWGIYNYMSGGTTRGWVWRYGNTTNVASISSEGHAAFTGSVTIGANATNTSGVRQVYDETTKSLSFVFVA